MSSRYASSLTPRTPCTRTTFSNRSAVDAARRTTERAVESGVYRLPKNPGSLATFEQLDDRFHAELESLAAKARAKDALGTSTQLGVVLSQCGGCHAQFRP